MSRWYRFSPAAGPAHGGTDPDRARDVLDRDRRVDAVLVQQDDVVGPQPAQGCVDDPADVVGKAVEAAEGLRPVRAHREAELRRDHDVVADRPERLADELLVDVRPVLSAVSNTVTPRSTAPRISRIIAVLSAEGPVGFVMPMQPRPMAETRRP
jgi:hypothetical protein